MKRKKRLRVGTWVRVIYWCLLLGLKDWFRHDPINISIEGFTNCSVCWLLQRWPATYSQYPVGVLPASSVGQKWRQTTFHQNPNQCYISLTRLNSLWAENWPKWVMANGCCHPLWMQKVQNEAAGFLDSSLSLPFYCIYTCETQGAKHF